MPEEMKPLKVMQTRFGCGNGNCLQAAVATLLNKNLDDVPDFASHSGLEWWDNLYAWCIENNYSLILIDDKQKSLFLNTYGIGVAKVKESEDETHAVVLKYSLANKGDEWHWECELYHDPNPKGTNIIEIKQHFFIFPKVPNTRPAEKLVPLDVDNVAEFLCSYEHGISLESFKGWALDKQQTALYKKSEDICARFASVPVVLEVDGETSDGYHTFNELYDHRCLLWINLCLINKDKCYLVPEHFAGWFLLGMKTDYGQISYHCPNKLFDLVKSIKVEHPEYDGHTSNDVIDRLTKAAFDKAVKEGR